MTCSARLPVDALLIGTFVPTRAIGPFGLRGLVLFGLYAAGVGSALAVAWVSMRLWVRSGYPALTPAARTSPSRSAPRWRLRLRRLRRHGTARRNAPRGAGDRTDPPAPPPAALTPGLYRAPGLF